MFAEADAVIDARNQRYDDWSGYPAMIDATLAALAGTAAHYLSVDNIYLYGQPGTPRPIDEAAPRHPISAKGQIRQAVERRLMQAMDTYPIAIARFPDFYAIATDPLPRGVRWFGPPDLPHQFIHLPDAARALLWLTEDYQSRGQVWHVAGADPIAGTDLRDLAQAVSRAPRA